jgi:hypothetical protein
MLCRTGLTPRRFRVELPCVNQVGTAGVVVKFREWLVKLIDEGRIADDKGVPHGVKVSVAPTKFRLIGLNSLLKSA